MLAVRREKEITMIVMKVFSEEDVNKQYGWFGSMQAFVFLSSALPNGVCMPPTLHLSYSAFLSSMCLKLTF